MLDLRLKKILTRSEAVVYYSKELGVLILTVEHNYICLLYYRGIITTTCFGPICGSSSGCDWTFGSVIQECVGRSWGVLGEVGAGRDLIITSEL